MDLELESKDIYSSIEIRREVGKCGNCKKETKFYDKSLDEYICCFECGKKLADDLYEFLETQG